VQLMNSTYRWIAFVGALLLAAMVGFAALDQQASHGVRLLQHIQRGEWSRPLVVLAHVVLRDVDI